MLLTRAGVLGGAVIAGARGLDPVRAFGALGALGAFGLHLRRGSVEKKTDTLASMVSPVVARTCGPIQNS